MKTKTKTETKAGEPARGALCAPSVGRFTRFVFVFVFVFIFVLVYSSSANMLIIRLKLQSVNLSNTAGSSRSLTNSALGGFPSIDDNFEYYNL